MEALMTKPDAAAHAHHWVIDEANGPLSAGRCKTCRPRKVFRLTRAGERVFLSDSRDLAGLAIERIAGSGEPDPLEGVARAYFEQRLRFGPPAGVLAAEQARGAADAFSAGGFFGKAEKAGTHGALICLYACPIAEIARSFPVFCEVEHEILADQLEGHDLKRIAHIPAGDEACVYRVAAGRAHGVSAPSGQPVASAAK